MLSAEQILLGLPVVNLPRRVLCFAQVPSTMDVAREEMQATSDTLLPLLVTAHEQSAGRGRQQRPWVAPPGTALLFSLAMRPTWLPPQQASVLVWLAGVSMCEGIERATGVQPGLKWPNDVLLNRPAEDGTPHWHKIAGLLLEASSSPDEIERAILGVGLNISASPPPAEVRYPATHLDALTEQPVDQLALLRAILVRMDDWYTSIQSGKYERLYTAWRNLITHLGHPVAITTNTGSLDGIAEDVDQQGALLIRTADGTLHTVSSGDVSGGVRV